PAGVRLSRGAVPRELLRQRSDEPHGDPGEQRPGAAGAAGADAAALLRPGAGGGGDPRGKPLAGGADRVVIVVARVPDEEAPRAVSGRGVGPQAAGGAAGGAARRMAEPKPRYAGGRGAARVPELGVPGVRDGRAAGGGAGLRRDVDLQLGQGGGDFSAGAGTKLLAPGVLNSPPPSRAGLGHRSGGPPFRAA